MHVKNLDDCELLCYRDDNCVSLNIKDKDPVSGAHECELNNSTHMEHEEDLTNNPKFYYRGAKVINSKNNNNNNNQFFYFSGGGLTLADYKCRCEC